MTRVAIIGTAGRREDAERLDLEVYDLMLEAFRAEIAKLPRPWDLVSGGAAYADHCAVDLFLEGFADSLTLHLPAPFFVNGNRLGDSRFNGTGVAWWVANRYHTAFSNDLESEGHESSFHDIAAAITEGAKVHVHDGFHARNLFVGQVDVVLAATFGRGKVPKDGGTKHTWDRSPAPVKIHISLHDLLSKEEPAQGELF